MQLALTPLCCPSADPPAGALEHALDQGWDLLLGEDGGGELAATVTGDEDAARLVDPDLLDGGVVEVGLQGAVARDGVVDAPGGRARVAQRWQCRGQAPQFVGTDDLLDEAADRRRLGGGVQPLVADDVADLGVDDLDRRHRLVPP